jgi:hypothetical protein
MLSPQVLVRVLAWYAPGHELVRDPHTHIHLAGILTREGDICRGRRPPFGGSPSILS